MNLSAGRHRTRMRDEERLRAMQDENISNDNIGNIDNIDNANDKSDNGQAQPSNSADDKSMKDRVDRLGGEAAPDISPEEFARLQMNGSLPIDAQGRIRANRRDGEDPGASLRKRRAWYSPIHNGEF